MDGADGSRMDGSRMDGSRMDGSRMDGSRMDKQGWSSREDMDARLMLLTEEFSGVVVQSPGFRAGG